MNEMHSRFDFSWMQNDQTQSRVVFLLLNCKDSTPRCSIFEHVLLPRQPGLQYYECPLRGFTNKRNLPEHAKVTCMSSQLCLQERTCVDVMQACHQS